jgi:hypothetical protein
VVRRILSLGVSLAALALMLPLARTPATAQGQIEVTQKLITPPGAAAPKGLPPAGPKGPVPRMADGKPDFSGIWNGQRALPGQAAPLMLPWAEKLTAERTNNYSADDPEARCLPGGVPRAAPYHYQLVQTPGLLLLLFEGNIHSYRQMFLDRREHLKNLQPLWYGDSIGAWDGDTLVVDTVGFNDKTELPGGYKHTESLHVVEHFHRTDFNNLDYEATIDDPNVFDKPWTIARGFPLRPDLTKVDEFVCENNHDYSKFFAK